jgi:hypothetical protein
MNELSQHNTHELPDRGEEIDPVINIIIINYIVFSYNQPN